MKILVACEESQAVTIELRRLGHDAYSCDIIKCSGGHPHTKKTCLWLKGLPPLKPTEIVKPENGRRFQQKNGNWRYSCWEMDQRGGKERARERSKTFPGIAKAMAEQWAGPVKDEALEGGEG